MFLPKWKWALNERRQMKMSHSRKLYENCKFCFSRDCLLWRLWTKANTHNAEVLGGGTSWNMPVSYWICIQRFLQHLCFFWEWGGLAKRFARGMCRGAVCDPRIPWFIVILRKERCFTSEATFNSKKAPLLFVITYLACWRFQSLAKQPTCITFFWLYLFSTEWCFMVRS